VPELAGQWLPGAEAADFEQADVAGKLSPESGLL
jgi:hypothetical protein